MSSPRTEWLAALKQSLTSQTLVKITLSKPRYKSAEWRNAYGRLVEIKGKLQLSVTQRFATRDETYNFSLEEAMPAVEEWLEEHFLNADLFTTEHQYSLQSNKKGKAHLQKKKMVSKNEANREHDQVKNRPLSESEDRVYLFALGIANAEGRILKSGQRKFRQINKYIEIIGHLLEEHPLQAGAQIVDMGSGKGYLTFALYDYLVNEKKLPVKITGIELRPALVDLCNDIAENNGFDGLQFVAGDIHQYEPKGGIDMLIALHACDTATDEALAKGIRAGADLLVVAPCCQKQVRRDMSPPGDLKPVLQHGILLERQAELLTDGLRALYLEEAGYRTKVFEFISTEHTPKNVMITARRSEPKPAARQQIDVLKATFGIQRHHLEDLLVDFN